jgi:hypothetical protein
MLMTSYLRRAARPRQRTARRGACRVTAARPCCAALCTVTAPAGASCETQAGSPGAETPPRTTRRLGGGAQVSPVRSAAHRVRSGLQPGREDRRCEA